MVRRKAQSPSLSFRLLRGFFALLLFTLFFGAVTVLGLYYYLEPQLPDIESLNDVRYQIPMNVYSKEGKLMAQYGEKKRTPVAITDVPEDLIHAFLAAEDDRFFDHPGVDYQGLLRAVFAFVSTGEKRQGGSTITMQVARNFFLSSEKTMLRKVREIMLAVKIESTLSKQRILELYLNKIYFGHHAYGIAAASQIYYGKPIAELDLAEMAMIAGLPKAPSRFNPIADPDRAILRRNYVLQRMFKLHYITVDRYQEAVGKINTAQLHTQAIEVNAPHMAEMVRNEMVRQYGEEAYVNGYQVYTTLDSQLQLAAEKSVRKSLHHYDRQRGYRGPQRRIDLRKAKTDADWETILQGVAAGGDTLPALVLSVRDKSATVYIAGTGMTELGWENMRWAKRRSSASGVATVPGSPKDMVKPGDIVRLQLNEDGSWKLSQIPEVEGSLVALNPDDGAVLAVIGGYDFALSSFNRATQSQRQPGSGFKPFLYSAAMENGYTPASIVVDAPIVITDRSLSGGAWRPKNYSGKFYGPTRLRVALAQSRNLVSVKLLKDIGFDKTIEMAMRFGFVKDELPRSMSLALGSGYASPLRMAQGYAAFANGGFRVDPYFITRIDSHDGRTIFQARPKIACPSCTDESTSSADAAPRILTPQVHYLMNSMLQDVIRTGTAKAALRLKRPDIAGKTGTTNDYRDAWFNGYAPAMVAVCWMGFDSFKSLGKKETGGELALPMWIDFMQTALAGIPPKVFPQPSGLTSAKIDPGSGMTTGSGNSSAVMELFPSDKVPKKAPKPKRKPAPAEDSGRRGESGGGRSMESLF
ncbi:MAG: penicillin-binding protein 1A [Methylotetracoccus sp.]|nr:penicillin-binding protein 1A [Methylotetracoccus sp.]